MTIAHRGLKVKVMVMGQPNAVGLTLVEGCLFSSMIKDGRLNRVRNRLTAFDNQSKKFQQHVRHPVRSSLAIFYQCDAMLAQY